MAEQLAKYEEIMEWITEQIENGEISEGERIYSENALVSMFQVSRQTVRHAISVLVDKGLLVSRRGSGTYVKDSRLNIHGRKKTLRIAAMMTYVDGYIFPSMIAEMERILSREGYSLQISFTNNTVERERNILKNFLKDDMIDGVIAEATKSGLPNPNLDIYRQLQHKGVPIIFVNCYYPELSAVHVSMDDFWAGKIATEHLLQCGHRKIGGVFKLDDGQGHKRYAGYMTALMEHDIKIDDSRICWIDTVELQEMKREADKYMRRLSDCTACVCYNDEVAVKLISICRASGMEVPESLSVVGIDNSDLTGYGDIPLTSVNNPVIELAKNAAESMLDLLNGRKLSENIELRPDLVVRNSTRIIDSYS